MTAALRRQLSDEGRRLLAGAVGGAPDADVIPTGAVPRADIGRELKKVLRAARPPTPLRPPTLVAATGERVPLSQLAVTVNAVQHLAEVVVQSTFVNDLPTPLEVEYQFPMDPAAAVYGFQVTVGGQTYAASVMEKRRAEDRYDDSTAAGNSAFMLQESQDAPDVLTVSVGNLAPGEAATVYIQYVAEMQMYEDSVVLFVPRLLGAEEAVLDGAQLSCTAQFTSTAAAPLVEASSPTHAIAVSNASRTGATFAMTTDADGDCFQRDFVVMVRLRAARVPRVLLSTSGGNSTMSAVFYPELPPQVNSEIFFVVDRSGSMKGKKIAQAIQSMQLFLRSMPDGVLFNVIGFGTRMETLFSEPQPYSAATFAETEDHIRGISRRMFGGADLGGTELGKPLGVIKRSPHRHGYSRQVIILTDGEVRSPKDIIKTCREMAASGDTRIFTVGIGREASRPLVNGCAEAGGGDAVFVAEDERLEGKVGQQLTKALRAAAVGGSVQWAVEGPGAEQVQVLLRAAPEVVPPVFHGSALTAHALVRGALPPGCRVTATYTATCGPLPIRLAASAGAAESFESPAMTRLTARAVMRDLADKSGAGAREELVELSTCYGLLCKHTAFFVEAPRAQPVRGAQAVRQIGAAVRKDTDQPASRGGRGGGPQRRGGRGGGRGGRGGARRMRDMPAPAPTGRRSGGYGGGDRGGGGGGGGGRMERDRAVARPAASTSTASRSSRLKKAKGKPARSLESLSRSSSRSREAAPAPPAPGGDGGGGGFFGFMGGPPAPPAAAADMFQVQQQQQQQQLFGQRDENCSSDDDSDSEELELERRSCGSFGDMDEYLALDSFGEIDDLLNVSETRLRNEAPAMPAVAAAPAMPAAQPAAAAVAAGSPAKRRRPRRAAKNAGAVEERKATDSGGQRSLDRLVVLQLVDGSWALDGALAAALGLPLERLQAARPAQAGDAQWATALAVAFLLTQWADNDDEWELLADKAMRWMGAEADVWVGAAREVLS